ncbi:MAG: carbon-nitrogen hydrolase family protein [Chloroflexi bacterium]|nr:carbon-nitrogen hydrolase family protein [Chloroflexota bacterium]
MGDVYPRLTVAAVQAASVFLDRDKTIDKAVRFIEEAADKDAVIIGFPELFVAGHPHVWYNAKKSNPLHVEGAMFTQLVKNGVKVPSPETDRLCLAAKKAHAYVVIGVSEVDTLFPGTVYNSQLFISDAGEIMGVHRKLVPTSVEKLIFSNGDGSYLNVFDTPYGKLSGMVCGEHAHDLYKYALLAMGAQVHVAGWPPFPEHIYTKGLRDSVDFRVRQFAYSGKIFVISCCGITDKQNITACCDTQEEADGIVEDSGGGSSIIGPNGEYLAGPMQNGEGVLTSEISLEDCLSGKQLHNVLGHYTRYDVLSLNFNRERLSPFKGTSSPGDKSIDYEAELRETRKAIREVNEKLDGLAEKLR